MITHEEALTPLKEIAEKLTRKQWLELTNKIETIRAYITQQKALQAEHEALKKDVARYFELSKNPTSNTNPNEIRPYIEWANELVELEEQILSKVVNNNG